MRSICQPPRIAVNSTYSTMNVKGCVVSDTQSLSERLREFSVVVYNPDGSPTRLNILTEAADALDAQAALLAQAAAELEEILDIGDASSGSDRGDLVASREIARKALAALRALIPE